MAKRDAISTATKLRLFADAAGHCQRCLDKLFPDEMGGLKHIAEMAHVIPHGDTGPRYEARPEDEFEVDSFENLILLCPTCHTIVDKNPEAYPRETLLGWKRYHLAALARKQGIVAYNKRSEVREAVAAGLAENKAIWEKFAPSEGSEFEYDPESSKGKTWTVRMRSVILPNHYRIQSIIGMNLHHASDAERKTFAEYQEHVRGLSARHICDEAVGAIRFPAAMENIFA
ncbi:HNH endonuclease [Agrobacterium rhizogenes]|nr:HNH endonuclease [Rhizobium rhizogenes]NTH64409.1 HNH endonuclease [Rhizobium rhizogenes]NTJ32089.1 HNH endonuclease [Rhizobium rhizogenes]